MKRQVAVGRTHVRVGIMLLTLAVMAFTATAALAITLSGDGTLVGTTGNDNISAGMKDDTIWGLGGSDVISAGSGNDVIDGGGTCPPGLAPGVYPNGLPGADYCQHGPAGTFGTDNISAGAGDDTVYGNGGRNIINLGSGNDTVFAFGGPNSVGVGNGDDTIFAYGTGNYSDGTGISKIFAQFSTGDVISCGSSRTTVYTVKGANTVSKKCTVVFVAPEPVPGTSAAATVTAKAAKTDTAKSSKANSAGLAVNRLAAN